MMNLSGTHTTCGNSYQILTLIGGTVGHAFCDCYDITLFTKGIGGSRGGHHGMHPPQQDQFLSFLHTFLLKSVCVGGWHPPMGRHPPMGNPRSATERGLATFVCYYHV